MEFSRLRFPEEADRQRVIGELIDSYHTPENEGDEQSPAVQRWIGVADAGRVTTAAREGVDIGSHTVSHGRLANSDPSIWDRELSESRDTLSGLLGDSCKYFCYPEGAWNPQAAKSVKLAGYVAAFTADHGLNSVGTDLMHLRRIHLPEDATEAELLSVMSGLRDTVYSMRRRDKTKRSASSEVQAPESA